MPLGLLRKRVGSHRLSSGLEHAAGNAARGMGDAHSLGWEGPRTAEASAGQRQGGSLWKTAECTTLAFLFLQTALKRQKTDSKTNGLKSSRHSGGQEITLY